MPSPWKKFDGAYDCCYGCVAPKRHTGCHETCPDFKERKEKEKAMKQFAKENKPPLICKYGYDMNGRIYTGRSGGPRRKIERP